MSRSPNSTQISTSNGPNSQALAEYHKLVAKGHFMPAISAPPAAAAKRQHTSAAQTAASLSSRTTAYPQQRAPDISFILNPPPHAKKPTQPPAPTCVAPSETAVLPATTSSSYIPPRQPPPGVIHTVPQGVTTSLAAIESSHAVRPQLPHASVYASSQPNTASPRYIASPNIMASIPRTAQAKLSANGKQYPIQGPSAARTPWLEPTRPLVAPVQQPQTISLPSITQAGLDARIQKLLQDTLPSWAPQNILVLSSHYTQTIMSLGRDGYLGPHGLTAYSDIFMVLGYEGKVPHRFLGLAVMAPFQLRMLLRTFSYDLHGKDPLEDEALLRYLKEGFHNVASDELGRINQHMYRSLGVGRR